MMTSPQFKSTTNYKDGSTIHLTNSLDEFNPANMKNSLDIAPSKLR